MLDTTFDLIAMAALNSHLVFCFCNLIIVILIAGGPKTASSNEDTTIATTPSVDHENTNYAETSECSSFDQNVATTPAINHENKNYIETSECSSFDQNELTTDKVDVKKMPCIKKASVKCNQVTINKVRRVKKVLVQDNEPKAEEEEDELRIRVEEFIEKINRGWKVEKLRTSLVH